MIHNKEYLMILPVRGAITTTSGITAMWSILAFKGSNKGSINS